MDAPQALIVERDPEVRTLLSGLLRNRGWAVVEATCRAESFDALDGAQPDLLVLDDPARRLSYRLVWLDADKADVRVQLVDLEPDHVRQQLEDLLSASAPRG